MSTLKILIQRPDCSNSGKFREIYRNTLTFNDNVNIPFNDLFKGLKLLYPFSDCIINFIVL